MSAQYVQNDDVLNVYRFLEAAKGLYDEDEAAGYSALKVRVFDAIFTSVSYLPNKVSGRYSRFADKEDLMQIGKVSLYNAIRTFDCTKGEHFFSWSYLWLVKSIKLEAQRQRKYGETFASKDIKELAEISTACVDIESEYDKHITAQCVNKALNSINDTSSKILKMSYGIGREPSSLREIGKEVGKSHEWVRAARSRALQSLATNRYIVEAAL